MFAALCSVPSSTAALTRVAQSFSPRVEVAGRLVLCDLVGVAHLLGTPRDVADHLRRALVGAGAVRIAVAPTHTAAALLALGRAGVSVAGTAADAREMVAALTVATLAEWDVLQAPREASPGSGTTREGANRALDVLRHWGVRTLGQYAALPAAELSLRLGPIGPRWRQAALGHDMAPPVPLAEAEPFEASLALISPVEGLEPLSFVLGRVLEPLAERLERSHRAAAVVHTELHQVTQERHLRTLPLPVPLVDPRTLRTRILLDLEAHPPAAAIHRVTVRVEPTPARLVAQSRVAGDQPSPERVATLMTRLVALMGESHVGSPQLDARRPGGFVMRPFAPPLAAGGTGSAPVENGASEGAVAFRRFRFPVPTRVTLHDGRPVRLLPDRRGVSGGEIVECAGPRRTPAHWWEGPVPAAAGSASTAVAQDRDEWDVVLADGVSCRVYLERDVGQWFIEGTFD